MNCNAVVIGRRGLPFPSAFFHATSTTVKVTTRRLFTTSPEHVRPLSRTVTLLAGIDSARSSCHASATDTSPRRPGSQTTLDISRIGFRQSPWASLRGWEKPEKDTAKWVMQRRWNSDSKKPDERNIAEQNAQKEISSKESTDSQTQATGAGGAGKYIYDHLPHFHRPTKDELLAAATGFWHRLQIRFKWFSIRSVRPFNHEEIFAFLSWIFWGHLLWLIIGTTTFVSLVIYALNTVFAQETLASWVGNYLTRSTGIQVVFESAIVPKWAEGTIRLNKVFVSRRPAADKSQGAVTKGSSVIAAAAAAASAQSGRDHLSLDVDAEETTADDGNYSQFDVTIDNVDLTLSFRKWFNGKGLLKDVGVRGVRGVIDRTHVKPRPEDVGRDPKSYRHEHNIGDFEIEHFKMEDVLITVYQPNQFRPFTVSVYNCDLPRLRKQWLFYDFLCANNMSGSFDGSLFTIHPRQVHSTTGALLVDGNEGFASTWKKHSRIRIDGLKIDHLNRGVEGPFSWIVDGNVDIVSDIMIPDDADGSIAKVMSDFYDRMEATVTNQIAHNGHASASASHGHDEGTVDNDATSPDLQEAQNEDDNRFLVMDIQIHLNDVRASVPIFTKDISYVNNAVVRPIVAYINSHSRSGSNFIPITCRIVKRQSEFDGSWTVFDSGLLADLSRETYDAFVRDLTDRKARQRRMKKVGLWAAQVAAQALFIGLAGQLA